MWLARTILFLQLGLSFLLFTLDLGEQFTFPKTMLRFAVVTILGFALVLSGRESFLSRARGWARGLPSDPVGLGLVAMTLSAVLSCAFSLSPRLSFFGDPLSWSGVVTIASYAALYFLTGSFIRSAKQAETLIQAAVFGAVVSAAYGALQFFHVDPVTWLDTLGKGGHIRPLSTVGHPNMLSASLVMALPLLLGRRRSTGAAILAAAFSVLLLFVVTVCESRGAWVALAATLVAYLSLKGNPKAIARNFAVVAATAAVAILLLYGATRLLQDTQKLSPFLGSLVHRFQYSLEPDSGRLEYWRGGLNIFRRYPLLGTGPDAFQLAFTHQRNAHYWVREWGGGPTTAHNELINVAATQGIVGLFALVLLLLGLGTVAWEALVRSAGRERVFHVALASGLVGFLVDSLSSFTVPTTGALFVTFAALLTRGARAPARADEADSETGLNLSLAALLLAAATVFFVNFAPLTAEALVAFLVVALAMIAAAALVLLDDAGSAVAAWRRGDARLVLGALVSFAILGRFVYTPLLAQAEAKRGSVLTKVAPLTALTSFEHAFELDRADVTHTLETATQAREIALNTADPAEKASYYRLALRGFEHAVKLVPENADYHYSVGTTLAEFSLKQPDLAPPDARVRAQHEIAAAMALEPENPIFIAGAINTAMSFGDCRAAMGIARRAVNVFEGYSIFPYYLGQCGLRVGDYVTAVEMLERAISGKTFHPAPATGLAISPEASFTEQDLKQARADLAVAKVELRKKEERALQKR